MCTLSKEELLEENKLLKNSLAEEKLLNFFNGRYYLIFDKKDIKNKINFFKFISMFYDSRFKEWENGEQIKKVCSVVWKYSLLSNHHQIEWADKEKYFKDKEYDLKELKYEEIKPYIDNILKAIKDPLFNDFI